MKCACGKEYKVNGWLVRHKSKCPVFQKLTLSQIINLTYRNHIDQLTTMPSYKPLFVKS